MILWSVDGCNHVPMSHLLESGRRFKNAYELLNLRTHQISMLYKNHIFQCMGNIFCMEFKKYLSDTLKDMDSRVIILELLDLKAHKCFETPPASSNTQELLLGAICATMRDIMTSRNGNIFPVTGHLCGEFTGPRKGQWRGALMFSLICVWINGSVNNREAGDLRHHRAHYDVIVMIYFKSCVSNWLTKNRVVLRYCGIVAHFE